MKNLILLATLMVIIVNACGQSKKDKKSIAVPEAVRNSFDGKFATATKVEWGIEKQGEYEAEFKMNKNEMSVVFDEKGNLLETETEIKKTELPQTVLESLKKEFGNYKIDEIEKVDSNGTTSYEMEAGKGKEKFELVFDYNGKLLQKEPKQEREEEEND